MRAALAAVVAVALSGCFAAQIHVGAEQTARLERTPGR